MRNISVKVYPYNGKGATVAFVTVELDSPALNGVFVIKGLTLVKGKNGYFVSFPSTYNKRDNKYYDIVYPTTKEDRTLINELVISEYEKEMKKLEKETISKYR